MKTALIASLIALAAVCVNAVVLAINNRTSTNVVLAVGALIGASALCIVQLSIELHPVVKHDHVGTDLTIDRDVHWIRQWKYPTEGASIRLSIDAPAGKKLKEASLKASADRDRVTRDFAVRSVLTVLAVDVPDWRTTRATYRTSGGAFIVPRAVAESRAVTVVSEDYLRQELRNAGNQFAEAPLALGKAELRLPPGSGLHVTSDSVVLENPVVHLAVRVHIPGHVDFAQPGAHVVPTLSFGEPRYETRLVELNVTSGVFALRAYDPRVPLYREWTDRIIARLRASFELQESDFASAGPTP